MEHASAQTSLAVRLVSCACAPTVAALMDCVTRAVVCVSVLEDSEARIAQRFPAPTTAMGTVYVIARLPSASAIKTIPESIVLSLLAQATAIQMATA